MNFKKFFFKEIVLKQIDDFQNLPYLAIINR